MKSLFVILYESRMEVEKIDSKENLIRLVEQYQNLIFSICLDEHNISAGVVTLAVREENGQLPQEAIGKADRNGGQIAEDQAQHLVRPGHA